jgi:hypothetical protein
MVYFNNTDDANLYTTTSTSGEFDLYPSQTLATEWANGQNYDAFANGWSAGYAVGSPRSLRAEASFGKHNNIPLDDHGLMCTSLQTLYPRRRATITTIYPGHHWPVANQHAQSYHSDTINRSDSFVNTMAPEFSAAISTPSGKCLL